MKVLIKNAKIYDVNSEYHLQTMDILVTDGVISEISAKIDTSADQTIESKELGISPGWIDVGAFNGEPGYEQRESLASLLAAGAKGGYAYIAPLPTTQPAIDTKSALQYLRSHNQTSTTKIIPLSSATAGSKGGDMAELIDLMERGAAACTDGPNAHISGGALMRISQYAAGAGVHYIHYLPHRELIPDGQIHEGASSVRLGLVGIPSLEEEIYLDEALSIAAYLDQHLYVQNISTSHAANLSESNDSLVASVAYLNLVKTDEDLMTFDQNLKVIPPLRTADDQSALKKAINDGTINCITSNHRPQLREEKDKEFGLSKFGANGLESCFAALCTHADDIAIDRIVHCLSIGGYEMLRLPAPSVSVGSEAVLTLFDASGDITLDDFASKCANNPFADKALKGKVIGVINVDQSTFFV